MPVAFFACVQCPGPAELLCLLCSEPMSPGMLEPVVFMPPVVDLVNRPCAAGTAAKVHMSNADAWDEGVRREAPAPPSCACCDDKEVSFVTLAVYHIHSMPVPCGQLKSRFRFMQ